MVFLFTLIKRKKSKLILGLGLLVFLSFYAHLLNDVHIREKTKRLLLEINLNTSQKLSEDFLFEQIDGFNLDKEASFFLISAKSIQSKNLTTNLKYSITKRDLVDFISLLYEGQAFLFDLNLINNIKLKDSKKSIYDIKANENNNIYTFKTLTNISFDNNKNMVEVIYISFGVFYKSFFQLHKLLSDNLDQDKCFLNYTFSYYENEKILTGIYVKCTILLIPIQIVYERANFLWIGANDLKIKSNKFFGDTPRALKKFNLSTLIDDDSNKFYIHSNLKHFLYEYENSKFLECNRAMLKENQKRLGPSYAIDEKKKNRISSDIEYVASSLESFYKKYWLDSGTLLGWYRDCGAYPHTNDIDFSMWSHEYEKKIKKHFMANKNVRIWAQLGLLNDSLEFRMIGEFSVDLFLNYIHNSTHISCPYHIHRNKYSDLIHKFDGICSAELFYRRYFVPCDPTDCLDAHYGKNKWITPETKDYKFFGLKMIKKWSDNEWPYVVRYYDKNGKLRIDTILEEINEHSNLKTNYTSLPKDDEDLIEENLNNRNKS